MRDNLRKPNLPDCILVLRTILCKFVWVIAACSNRYSVEVMI